MSKLVGKRKGVVILLLAALMVCVLVVPAASALASMRANPTDLAADVRLDNPGDDVVETRCAVTGDRVFEFADGSTVTVLHYSPASILLGGGGPIKCERNANVKTDIVLQLIRPSAVTTLNIDAELAAPDEGVRVQYFFPRHFDDFTENPFGNSDIRTEHYGTADRSLRWCWWDGSYHRDEVSGTTRTEWLGTVPQWNPDEIKLAESWTFHGVAITVSVPAGAGFSSEGDTVSWSAHDTDGTRWWMYHEYVGVAATTEFWFTGVTKDSAGSHRFGGTWVSAFVHTPGI